MPEPLRRANPKGATMPDWSKPPNVVLAPTLQRGSKGRRCSVSYRRVVATPDTGRKSDRPAFPRRSLGTSRQALISAAGTGQLDIEAAA